jgi:hypothetical protein
MSNEEKSVDVEAIMADPTATFAQPRDVLTDPRFSREIKLKILQRWEHDARSLAVAEGEGMSGGEESMHGRVLHAIRSLEESTGKDRAQTEGKLDESASQLRNSYSGLVDTVRTAGCQVIQGTRNQPLAALMIAAWLGYVCGRVRHRL